MIRLAVPEDSDGLAEVHVRSWQHAYRGTFSDPFLDNLDVERRAEFFAGRIGAGAAVFVSDSEGDIVAFCWATHGDEEDWGEILAIYAHPDHWGHGHGRALLEAAERHLRGKGLERVLLWVLDSNTRARDFYERQGWSLGSGMKIEEIGGVQVTEVRYEKEL